MVICPQGHRSESTDYCDVCGTPIPASAQPAPVAPDQAAPSAPEAPTSSSKLCPHCGAANPPGALFCEACGYDFTTGSLPRGAAPSAPVAPLEPVAAPVVAATPNPLDLDAPLAPAPAVAASVPVPEPVPAAPVAPVAPEPVPVPAPAPEPVQAAAPVAAEPTPKPAGPPRFGGATAYRPPASDVPAPPTPVVPASPAPEPAATSPLEAPVTPAASEPQGSDAPTPEPVVSEPVAPSAPVDTAPPVVVAATPPLATSPDGPHWAPGAPASAAWVAEVWIDPDWYAGQDSPDQLPSPGLPRVVGLRKRTSLVGRPSKSRGIHPDVDCEPDTGVSRRHAELTTDGSRWWVEDLGSSNGTFVGANGAALPNDPITGRTEIDEDSRIYVGSWTRIVVRRAAPDEAEL